MSRSDPRPLGDSLAVMLADKALRFHPGKREELREATASSTDLRTTIEAHLPEIELAFANTRSVGVETAQAWSTVRASLGLPDYNKEAASKSVPVGKSSAPIRAAVSPARLEAPKIAPSATANRAPISAMAEPASPESPNPASATANRAAPTETALPAPALAEHSDTAVAEVLALVRQVGLPGFCASHADAVLSPRQTELRDDGDAASVLALVKQVGLPGFKSSAPSG